MPTAAVITLAERPFITTSEPRGPSSTVAEQAVGSSMNTRQRASVLTKDDARAIYQVKRSGKCRQDAALLGAHYGISAKAVRDVWNHRTWSEATMCLWTLQDVTKYVHTELCSIVVMLKSALTTARAPAPIASVLSRRSRRL